MRRVRWTFEMLCVVAALSVAAGTAFGQARSIGGVVVDGSGAAIAGAGVSTTVPPVASTMTDANGAFTLPVPSGAAVDVQVEKAPFRSRLLRIASGDTYLRVVLDVEGVAERVGVVAPLIEAATFDGLGGSRTIVSSDQIRDLNAVDLAAALRRTPGVTVSRFNPVGSFGGSDGGAVYVRGMGASRPGSEIKAYVDGAPFYMGVWGHPLLDLLPVNGMDRVSVLKGPQPQSFGNAFSAIDLSSRRARGDLFDGSVRLAGGAFSTFVEQVDVAARRGPWDFAAAQGFARSAGHREDASGRLFNGLGRVGYRWSDRWSADALVLHVDNASSDPGRAGQPETKTGRYETSGTLFSTSLSHAHGDIRGTLQFYANRAEGNWLGQPAPEGNTLTTSRLSGLRWRETWRAWTAGTLSGGVDVDRIDGDAIFDRLAPAPSGVFTGEAFTLAAPHLAVEQAMVLTSSWVLTPSAGVRYYRHSVFDTEVAPHVGLVARHGGGLALRASYARGVSYPGQEVVALSSLIPPLGNTWRQLDAETMDHVEIGAAFTPTSTTSIDAALFDDHVSNRFLFGFPPAVTFPTFTNLEAYGVRGAEVSVQQRLGSGWQAFAGLTLLDPSLGTLPYAPSTSLVLGVTGAVGPWRLSVDTQSQTSMYVLAQARTAGATNTARVDGFTVLNLRPSYRLSGRGDGTDVFIAIENLFDSAYAFRPGYPMPGVSVQAGLTIPLGAVR